MNGTLYIVATPIGNMGDITQRADKILREVDAIAAEDTRHTLKLLNALRIKNKLISCHEYSDIARINEICDMLLSGQSIALVTDAGTPLISDPGAALTEKAAELNIDIVPVPGACAAISALTVSAIPCGKFIFEGFLPRDKTRKDALKKLTENTYTSVIYESPHHLTRTLAELSELIPQRRCAIARELTKLHEQVLRTTIFEASEYFAEHEPRGEFVIVIAPAEETHSEPTDDDIIRELEQRLEAGETRKTASANVAAKLGVNKNRAYKLSLDL